MRKKAGPSVEHFERGKIEARPSVEHSDEIVRVPKWLFHSVEHSFNRYSRVFFALFSVTFFDADSKVRKSRFFG